MKSILLLSLCTLTLGLSSCANCCKTKSDCCKTKSACCDEKSAACCDKKPADGSKCAACDSNAKTKKM